jgi:hypothetical protein
LGYITSTNENLTLFSKKIIGQNWSEVKELMVLNNFNQFEIETIEGTENYFYENIWLFLNIDYGKVFKVELGAVFIDKEDSFDWKFNPN